MIVDSCTDTRQGDKLPVLEYLWAMGVDVATAVKLVVATHWHDDHIGGMSAIVEACESAAFVCSGALKDDELLIGIGKLEPYLRDTKITSGVREMKAVFELLANPDNAGGTRQAEWAGQNRLLYRPDGLFAREVLALTPSDKVVQDGFQVLVRLIRQGGNGRVPSPKRNVGAVVLWVEVGDATMLLGSDLQEDPDRGWTAVLSCRAGKGRQGEVFKVPHHGSANGHNDLVWERLLVKRPEAVVCPHSNGRNNLPTADDVQRLCDLARVHVTALGPPAQAFKNARLMRPAVGGFGRVTLRRAAGANTDWTSQYSGEARELCAGVSR